MTWKRLAVTPCSWRRSCRWSQAPCTKSFGDSMHTPAHVSRCSLPRAGGWRSAAVMGRARSGTVSCPGHLSAAVHPAHGFGQLRPSGSRHEQPERPWREPVVAAGDIQAELAAAQCVGGGTRRRLRSRWRTLGWLTETATTRGTCWHPCSRPTAGARPVRVQAWLIDARLSYDSADRARSRRSLASALRLAEPEQLRLPFAAESGWIGPVLRRAPELAGIHWCLLPPALRRGQLPALPGAPEHAAILAVEPLSERQREVPRHVSGLQSNAEVATEICVCINTVKTHLKTSTASWRRLAAPRRFAEPASLG